MRSSQSQAGMASAIACLFLGTSVLAQGEPVFPRSYLEDVCKPAIKNPGDVIPPCINIETIEAACHANGTTGLYLEAHQQCMCRGSFFPEWFACLDCVYLHGLRSPREFAFYQAVGSAASTSFCAAATPTAEWSKVFSSQENVATQVSTGATVGSDSAPSQTAVSLYYTPTGPQGPGAITGSATAATATGSTSTPASSSGSSSKSGSTTGGSSGTQTTSSGSSTTTQPNAAGRAQLGAGSIVFTVLLMGSKLLL